MISYREDAEKTTAYKKEYADGIIKLIENRQKEAEKARCAYAKDIFKNTEKYRAAFKEMLGWPLVGHKDDSRPAASFEKLADEENCEIYRVRLAVIDELTLTGLFFRQKGDEKRPLIIAQHGGLGTPELISGVYGDTGNYTRFPERILKRNVHVFCPQLLLWADAYNVPFSRGDIDNRLKRVGSSIAALEVYALTRVLDYFEEEIYVSVFGMAGLSYGGFYTQYAMAADTRILAGISCSYFLKRDKAPWGDWTWKNSAYLFDDAEIACLVYPRNLSLLMGKSDELFDWHDSADSFERVKQLADGVGTDWIGLELFEGVHEYPENDDAIERMLACLRARVNA